MQIRETAGNMEAKDSAKALRKGFWAGLSPVLCILVGISYRHFNEHYVVNWWVHCKHCTMAEVHKFDANDFTLIFFASLWLLTTVPLFFMSSHKRWLLRLSALAVNALICLYFVTRNIWA